MKTQRRCPAAETRRAPVPTQPRSVPRRAVPSGVPYQDWCAPKHRIEGCASVVPLVRVRQSESSV